MADTGDLTARDPLAFERAQDFARIASDWFWETDVDGRFRYISKQFEDMTPYRTDDFIGRHFRDFEEAGGLVCLDPQMDQRRTQAMAAHQPFGPLVYHHPDRSFGESYWEVKARPFKDAHGRFAGYRGVSMNVTEKQQAIIALERNRQHFRHLFDTAPSGLLVHRNFRPVLANQAFLDIFDYDSLAMLLAENDVMTLVPDERTDEVYKAYRKLEGADEQLLRDRTELISRKGRRLIVDFMVCVTDWDGEDAFYVTVQDVTGQVQAAERLQRSEKHLADAQTLASIGSWDLTADGRLTCSDEFYRICDLNPLEDPIPVERFLDVVHPEDRHWVRRGLWIDPEMQAAEGVWPGFSRTVDAGGRIHDRYRLCLADGAVRHVHVIQEARGEPERAPSLGGVIRDVTTEEAAKRRIAESEDRYNRLFSVDSIGHVIWQDEWPRDANRWALEIFDHQSRDDFVNHYSLWSIRPAAQAAALRQAVSQLLTSRDAEFKSRWLATTVAGRDIWVESSLRATIWNGKPALQETLMDVTAEVRYAQALKKSEERYELVVEAAQTGIFEWNVWTRRGFISTTGLRLLGMSGGNYVAFEDFEDRLHSEDRGHFLNAFRSGPTAGHGRFRIRHASGQYRRLEIQWVSAHPHWGEPHVSVGSFRDVTDEYEAAKTKAQLEVMLRQSQKMEALGRLAGGIAHEINNLLQPVLLFAKLAREEADAEQLDAYLEDILGSARKARDVTRGILAFSRPDTGATEPSQFSTIMGQAVAFAAKSLPSGVHLDTDIPDLVDQAAVNQTALSQVLLNLFQNAADAMANEGRIMVSLAAVTLAQRPARALAVSPGPYFQIIVADTGPGMAAGDCERVFEPFFTTKDPGKGTGLGLSIVHAIVKTWQGAVHARSRPGDGTVFEVYVPRVLADGPRLSG